MPDRGTAPRGPLAAAAPAGLAYFAVVFAAGFALGSLRVLLLLPRVGETVAVILELPLMLGVSWLAARWLVARFDVPHTLGPRLAMGGLALALLLFAEVAVSLLAFGRSLAEHVGAYRELPALLGLVGQIGFAAFPSLQLVRRR